MSKDKCKWILRECIEWACTGCENYTSFNGCKEIYMIKNFKYCPYCGKEIEVSDE